MPPSEIIEELVWTSSSDTRVASYPPECLPSRYTIYKSIFSTAFFGMPPSSGVGLGTGLTGGALISAVVTSIPGFSARTFNSYHKHIFARCEYRHNEPLILTQEMIDTGTVEMPNYIFEIISVSPKPVTIPPYIKFLPKYTINIAGKNPFNDKVTIQFELMIDTDVTWKITNVFHYIPDVPWEAANIDSNGLLTVSPLYWGTGELIVEVTATNEMGEYLRSVTLNIINETGAPDMTTEWTEDYMPSKESIEDWLWNRTAEEKDKIEPNILKRILPNQLGVYFRLDNATDKSFKSEAQTGIQTLVLGATYNDASSKKFEIDFSKDENRTYRAGDIVYVTYCAVEEHYIRQTASVEWSVFDFGLFGFSAFPSRVNASNYRFYEWELPGTENENDDPATTSTKVSGWRCVESVKIRPNITGILTSNVSKPTLANFLVGEYPVGIQHFSYLPSSTPVYKILEILDEFGNEDETKLAHSSINLSRKSGREAFQPNVGFYPSEEDPNPVSLWDTTNWAQQYLKFEQLDENYIKMINHLVFNVHPEALKKRDVDKWAIPFNLATSLEKAINTGEETYFPFMDNAADNEPHLGTSQTLNSDNFEIDPFDGGSVSIGSVVNRSSLNSRSVSGEFSPGIINEQFKKGTKVLVERDVGGIKSFLYIRCRQGAGEVFVSAINDLSLRNAYIFSTNFDGFLIQRSINYSAVARNLGELTFQPDKGGINYAKPNVETTNEEYPVKGFCGLLGDSPGTFPGKAISFYKYSDKDAFTEYYIGKPQTELNSTKEISRALEQDSYLLMQLGELVYTGSLKIEMLMYKQSPSTIDMNDEETIKAVKKLDDEVSILFLSGNSVESAIDRNPVKLVHKNGKLKLIIEIPNYYWLKGDSIRIQFSSLKDFLSQINPFVEVTASIIGLKNEYAQDFTTDDFDVTILDSRFPLWKGKDFIKTGFATSYIDESGLIYLFFGDEEQGISCVYTVDEGTTWNLQYSLVSSIEDESAQYPFCVKSSIKKELFLFFVMKGVLYVMPVDLKDLDFNNAFQNKETAEKNKNISFFEKLRSNPFYVAAGNNDAENINFVQTTDRFRMGTTTIFTNVIFSTPFFSGYQTGSGELRIFFPDKEGRVQCNYSHDNGISWNDLWICMKEGYDGIIKSTDDFGKSTDKYPYGINPHPSITKTEDQIESPYVFQSQRRNQIYLFYVYKGCLLCKMFEDPISCQLINGKNNYDMFVDSLNVPSVFVDGNAKNIEDEIGTIEKPNNVIMKHQYAIDQFDETREIEAQRVSAILESNGSVKVYYKTADDDAIRAAWQDGFSWEIEDMMHLPEEAEET